MTKWVWREKIENFLIAVAVAYLVIVVAAGIVKAVLYVMS